MNVIRLDPEGHARVQSLLPWYVTGRLDAAEQAEVEKHLAGCARCRAELALERQLHAALDEGDQMPEPAASRGLATLQQRLATGTPGTPRRLPPVGWRWALALQSAAIIALAVWGLLSQTPKAPYRGLGSGGSGANAVVMFSPEATEAQIRSALRASGAHLAGGPTATQAYLLVLPVADARTLAALRAQPGVTLAESLAAEDER